jgi:7-keto-8-aminopelargonate synthetase-like enzyme
MRIANIPSANKGIFRHNDMVCLKRCIEDVPPDMERVVVGLTFPVVPKGDETIRFQINACHTEEDINYVLNLLVGFNTQ